MTNKLKQIEGKLASLRKIANIPNGWQESTDEVEMLIEALALLKEVEEGNAHVMRWVEVKDDDCFDLEHALIDTVSGLCVGCGVVGYDDFHYATFNNNNGEIPMPKESE